MADAFVSYAREEQQLVQRIAAALSERDKSVWIDEQIEPSISAAVIRTAS